VLAVAGTCDGDAAGAPGKGGGLQFCSYPNIVFSQPHTRGYTLKRELTFSLPSL
jgi:hypothetical protein